MSGFVCLFVCFLIKRELNLLIGQRVDKQQSMVLVLEKVESRVMGLRNEPRPSFSETGRKEVKDMQLAKFVGVETGN